MDNNSPLELVERAASLVSEELLVAIQDYVSANWSNIVDEIAKHPDEASLFFNENVISLSEIYSDSTSLFVKLDERSVEPDGDEPAAESEV